MNKKTSKRKKERIKTVKTTSEVSEHYCSEECFKPHPKLAPKELRKVLIGEIYQDKEGRFYHEWGENDWLEVTGLSFMSRSDGELGLLFHPKHQLHIHSLGGKIVSHTSTQQEIKTTADYHAAEAVKRLKRKKLKLRQAQDFLRDKAAEQIPRAPKHQKPTKGIGRGAPDEPRSETAREIIRLIKEGKRESEVLEMTIDFAKAHKLPIAGLNRRKIKKQVQFWMKKVDR